MAIVVPRLELLFLALPSIFAGKRQIFVFVGVTYKMRDFLYAVGVVETGRVFPFKYEKNSKIQIFINLSDHNLN